MYDKCYFPDSRLDAPLDDARARLAEDAARRQRLLSKIQEPKAGAVDPRRADDFWKSQQQAIRERRAQERTEIERLEREQVALIAEAEKAANMSQAAEAQREAKLFFRVLIGASALGLCLAAAAHVLM